jgi:hypothetical protein
MYLNIKDHIRKGDLQEVINWQVVTLLTFGFDCIRRVPVLCPGQRHGANGHLRVNCESVICRYTQSRKVLATSLSE